MLTLRVALMAWGVVGPVLAGGVAYLAMLAREHIVVAGAAAAARGEEVTRCNEQRSMIAREINAAVDRGIEEARTAASATTATPELPAELLALCKASTSCRDRGAP